MHGTNLCGGLASIVMLMQLLAMPGFGHAQGSSSLLFQCQPSLEQDGLVFTPNIPDFYFNHENAGNFRTDNPGANLTSLKENVAYIFTIPPMSSQRNCSGTVVAIQFCYEYRDNSNLGSDISAFQFLTLTRDGLVFTVNSSFTVNTTLATCTSDLSGMVHRVCCSKVTLNDFGEFAIPSSDLIFGIAHMMRYQLRLLAFDPMVREYQFNQYQVTGVFTVPGTNTQLAEGNLVRDHSLPLLRFFIDTDGTDPTTISSNAPDKTSNPTTDDGETTNSTTTRSRAPGGSRIAMIGGVVGGVVGGIVAVVLILLFTLLIILLVRRRQRRATSKNISYNNAIYGVTETRKDANQASAARQEANGATTDGPVYSVVDVSHKKSSKSAATELLPSQSEGTYSVVTSANDEGEGYSALDRRDNGGEQEAYSTLDHTVSSANGGTVQGEAYSILNHTSKNQKAGNTEPNAADDYDQIESVEEEYGQLEHT